MRNFIFFLTTLVVFMLIVDTAMAVSVIYKQLHHSENMSGSMPMLTLSPSQAKHGQIISLSISHCQPLSHIILSHDLWKPLNVTLVQTDETGDTVVYILVGNDWEPGAHRIEAEEINTHTPFFATLRVITTATVWPPLFPPSS